MSGTRSRSPRAPVTEALIVAHGQPGAPGPAQAEIARLAGKVAALLPGWQVRGATLAMPGALDEALAAALAPPLVYPLFMSAGWFTTKALPERLDGRAGPILMPLGCEPALAGLAAQAIKEAAREQGWPTEQVTLILAAHGSGRSRNPARVSEAFAQALADQLPLAAIRVGFIEQAPRLAEAARAAGPTAFCLPFFAAGGGHVRADIPEALAKAGFGGVLLEPLGLRPEIPALIAKSLAASA